MTVATQPRINRDKLLASICKDSYWEFVKRFWDVIVPEPMVYNWHLEYLANEAQKVMERIFLGKEKLADPCVNQPPGSTKTLIWSVFPTPWAWTRMPTFKMIGASYSEDLSLDISVKSRDIVESELYQRLFPHIKPRPDQWSKAMFQNMDGGWRFAVGVKGAVTGKHSHLITVDDPLNPEQAASDLELATANRWISQTLSTRKIDKAVSVTALIMQRLHEDDPTANFVKKGRIKHICLPAEDGENVSPPELRANYVDGLLDPIRLSRNVLDEARGEGEQFYATQFLMCLIGSTLVTTDRGYVPIKDIVPGDNVLTRQGYRQVLWSGNTKDIDGVSSVLFENGSVVAGTPEHPVWCEGVGWVSLDALGGSMYNVVDDGVVAQGLMRSTTWDALSCLRRKLLSSREYDIYGLTRLAGSFTFGAAFPGGKHSTAPYGGTTTVTSPKAMTFTTKTATRLTIELRILSASLRESMACGTVSGLELHNIASFLRRSANLLWPGIGPWMDRGTTKSLVESLSRRCGKSLPTELTFVLPVGAISGPDIRRWTPNIALGSARRKGVFAGAIASSVSGARTDLLSRGKRRLLAPSDAPPCGGGMAVPVYDIAVDGAHEFYANGILVHNSPMPPGGAMFKVEKLRHGIPPERFKLVVRYWDKAGSSKKRAAFTVGTLMGEDYDGRFWVLDVVRGRWEAYTREKMIRQIAGLDGVNVHISVEREPGSGGMESAENTIRGLAGYRVSEDRVDASSGGKEMRADVFASQVNGGNVWLPSRFRQGNSWAGWAKEWVEELRYFPHSKYKDQVDSSSGGFRYLRARRQRAGGLS